MKIRCAREGRMGFHIGDVIEIPDGTETFDHTYFIAVEDAEANKAAAKTEEKAAETAKPDESETV